MKGLLILPVILILLFGTPAFAGPSEGVEAYQSGDYATALREFKPYAENGQFLAQYFLGTMYAKGQGVAQDDKAAIKWYKLSAEQGFAEAQFNLGVYYYQGQGVTQDYKIALKWFKLAAEEGNTIEGTPIAQYQLGMMFAQGQGVIQDYIFAHMWWNIAASLGFKEGAENRDIVGKMMTPSQLEKAQDLARECVAKNYKDC